MRLAGGGAQGEAGGAFAGDDTDVGGVVLEYGSVADELVLQRGIGIENGREPVAEWFAR